MCWAIFRRVSIIAVGNRVVTERQPHGGMEIADNFLNLSANESYEFSFLWVSLGTQVDIGEDAVFATYERYTEPAAVGSRGVAA